jgi:hypothetical protein
MKQRRKTRDIKKSISQEKKMENFFRGDLYSLR